MVCVCLGGNEKVFLFPRGSLRYGGCIHCLFRWKVVYPSTQAVDMEGAGSLQLQLPYLNYNYTSNHSFISNNSNDPITFVLPFVISFAVRRLIISLEKKYTSL